MNEYWVWFSRLCKIDVKTKNKLLEKYKTPEKIWNLSKKDLERNTFLNQEKIEYILNQDYRMNLKKYIEYMEENQIHLITIKDKEYPCKLKEMYDSPIAIFTKGNKDLLKQKSIAIIGSRSCSSYGKFISKNFAYGLAKNNIVVISGLARGIDTYAHSGTLKIKNSTIAVVRIWIRSSLS